MDALALSGVREIISIHKEHKKIIGLQDIVVSKHILIENLQTADIGKTLL